MANLLFFLFFIFTLFNITQLSVLLIKNNVGLIVCKKK